MRRFVLETAQMAVRSGLVALSWIDGRIERELARLTEQDVMSAILYGEGPLATRLRDSALYGSEDVGRFS